MNIKNHIESLTETKRFELAVELLKLALPVWNNFAIKTKNLEYVDSVVGLYHKVDENIIQRILNSALKWKNKHNISDQLVNLSLEIEDPIVALQDFDWKLPENIKKIFYSACNLVRKMNGQ